MVEFEWEQLPTTIICIGLKIYNYLF